MWTRARSSVVGIVAGVCVTCLVGRWFGDALERYAYDARSAALESRIGSFEMIPFGNLGPMGTAREGLRYYDVAMTAMWAYARGAESALEIGCVRPSFVGHANWIAQKTCIAPYYAAYKETSGLPSVSPVNDDVSYVTADFMRTPLKSAELTNVDLCVCMQVLEHVSSPDDFLRKMLNTELCKVVIVSVPYMWADCGSKCSHVTHNIDETTVMKWSGGRVPAQTTVVHERGGTARLIVVYEVAPL